MGKRTTYNETASATQRGAGWDLNSLLRDPKDENFLANADASSIGTGVFSLKWWLIVISTLALENIEEKVSTYIVREETYKSNKAQTPWM